MIDRHWDGIAAYSRPENKVSLGFVEGLNNKIRVIQRRAYGLRDDEYLQFAATPSASFRFFFFSFSMSNAMNKRVLKNQRNVNPVRRPSSF